MSRKELAAEYKRLALINAEHARIAALAKQRMNEIEAEFFEPAKKSGAIVVDHIIVRYVKTTSTTHSYSDLWRQALKVVDEDKKAELEKYKDDNARHNVQESIEVIDASFVEATKGLKQLTLDELLDVLSKFEE